jgi:hypothetical protein
MSDAQKKLVVSHVQLLDRKSIDRKMSKATVGSYTRVYFEEQDVDAAMVVALSGKKKCSLYRPLMQDALKAAGLEGEKFNWNDLAGCLKGERPGFICRSHKGHELIVTFAVEGAELSKPVVEEPIEIEEIEELITADEIEDIALSADWEEIILHPEASFEDAKKNAA